MHAMRVSTGHSTPSLQRRAVLVIVLVTLLPIDAFSATIFELQSTTAECSREHVLSKLLLEGPVPPSQRNFLINGWRWHTLSVLRDLDRFEAVLAKERSARSSEKRLLKAHDFLWKFSWTALLKVEHDIFFPWLEKSLPSPAKDVIKELRDEGRSVRTMGEQLGQVCAIIYKGNDLGPLDNASDLLGRLRSKAQKMREVQETFIVPLVSAYIPQKDQRSFNNRVLASLGLLNSQVHLVGMRDAVKMYPAEEHKFKQQIPSIAQMMLPVWRRNFYNSQSRGLETD